MREVVICAPVRTPVGRFGGALKDIPAQDLAAAVIREVLARTGLPGTAVDDVVLGHCYPTAEAPAIGRVAALDAGLPVTVGGLQVARRCGSGLQAVILAALAVRCGDADVILAGGAESMSNAPLYSMDMRWGSRLGGVTVHDALIRGRVTVGGHNHPTPGGMLQTAETLRRDYGIPLGPGVRAALRSTRSRCSTSGHRGAPQRVRRPPSNRPLTRVSARFATIPG